MNPISFVPYRRRSSVLPLFLMGGLLLPVASGLGAESPPSSVEFSSIRPVEALFPDEVLCRGQGVEIRRSRLDRAYRQFSANATARGQQIPESRVEDLENLLLDRLVVSQLLLRQATAEDTNNARGLADKFTTSTREKAGSEASFERQLLAMGFTPEDFEAQVFERAVCEEVVERLLRPEVKITDDQVRAYYETNAHRLQRPETVQVSHILLASKDPGTGAALTEEQLRQKRVLAEQVLLRARQGEDFDALVQQYSEDRASLSNRGIYTFARGQMAPEFEAAAFSLQPNQISDVVTTAYGFHIIKVLRRVPSEQIEFSSIRDEIRSSLERGQIQDQLLPRFLLKLKEQAKLEYLNGAAPPPPMKLDPLEPLPQSPGAG